MNYYPLVIMFSLSTLFLAFSNWWSILLLDLSLWSKVILNFSNIPELLDKFFSFSDLPVLFHGCINWSVLRRKLYRCDGDFSTIVMNFFTCLMYSGKSSKSQWLPPLSHNGSYFSLHSSQLCLPWEQSTTSSKVPNTIT